MGFIARFLPSLAPGLSALANPWVLLIAIALLAVGFAGGIRVEAWRWDASLVDIERGNVAHLKDFMRREANINGALSDQLAAERTQSEIDRMNFDEELQHAKDERPQGTILTVHADPAATGAAKGAGEPAGSGLSLASARLRVTCDSACIRLWHDGLAQGLPSAYGDWRADAAAGAPDSVDETELIANAAANFRVANGLRSQLLAWQRKACAEGWATKAQCVGVGQ